MKCSQCQEEKPEEEFFWKKKGEKRHSYCKECSKKNHNEHYKNNEAYRNKQRERTKLSRKKAKEKARGFIKDILKNSCCVDCGESNLMVLEFDHVSGEKVKSISKMMNEGTPLSTLKRELDKCEVVCANCHRIRTYQRGGSWRLEF